MEIFTVYKTPIEGFVYLPQIETERRLLRAKQIGVKLQRIFVAKYNFMITFTIFIQIVTKFCVWSINKYLIVIIEK